MTRWLTPLRCSTPIGRRNSNGRKAPWWLPSDTPLSQTCEAQLTDSKRTIHVAEVSADGNLKSLRYQVTPPMKPFVVSSVAFHAYGTWMPVQPTVDELRSHLRAMPTPCGSARNSHVPSTR